MPTDDETRSFLAETSCARLVRKFGHGGLVLSTVPQPGESLQGFVGRCLALNGHQDFAAIARILGFGYGRRLRSSRWSHREISSLERVTGVAKGALSKACRIYQQHGSWWVASYGAVVPISHMSMGARRISSASLRRSPYHRAAWMFRAMPVCPESRELLVENCPQCGSRLDWAKFIGMCRCPVCARNGECIDLRELPPRPAESADEKAIDFLTGFLGHDLDKRRKAISMLPTELSCLTIQGIYLVGYHMAELLIAREHPEPRTRIGLKFGANNWGLREAELMARQILDWPKSLFVLCEHSYNLRKLHNIMYSTHRNYRDIYSLENYKVPEVKQAFVDGITQHWLVRDGPRRAPFVD